METWSSRSTGYKLGVSGLSAAMALYLIGYASPFWFDFRTGSTHLYSGLWMACHDTSYRGVCTSSVGNEANWFKAVQAMETVGLLGLFLAGVDLALVHCCQRTVSWHRLEAVSVVSGLSGFIGCMVFVGEAHRQLTSPESIFGWAFCLSLAGSLLAAISAAIIYVYSRREPATPTTTSGALTGVAASAPVPQSQGYPGQGPPPQPVVYYVAQAGHPPPAQACAGVAQYPGYHSPDTAYPPPTAPPVYVAPMTNKDDSGSGPEAVWQ